MDSVIKRLRTQRQLVVELDDGRSVTLLRPRETEFDAFRSVDNAELVSRYAVGWSGFTEASLFGESVGSSDPLPFSTELWDEVVRDRAEWVGICITKLVEVVNQHMDAKAAAAKN